MSYDESPAYLIYTYYRVISESILIYVAYRENSESKFTNLQMAPTCWLSLNSGSFRLSSPLKMVKDLVQSRPGHRKQNGSALSELMSFNFIFFKSKNGMIS